MREPNSGTGSVHSQGDLSPTRGPSTMGPLWKEHTGTIRNFRSKDKIRTPASGTAGLYTSIQESPIGVKAVELTRSDGMTQSQEISDTITDDLHWVTFSGAPPLKGNKGAGFPKWQLWPSMTKPWAHPFHFGESTRPDLKGIFGELIQTKGYGGLKRAHRTSWSQHSLYLSWIINDCY